jgi:hypothetical protein
MMLIDDITNHLSTSVSGLTVGVNLWKLPVPETASSSAIQVSVVEYPGRPAMRAMGPSAGAPVAEISRFNVAVYGQLDDFENTRGMAESIYTTLDYMSETTLGTTRYLHVRALQPPIHLPPDDENAQHHFSVNFEAMKVRG